MTPQQGMLLQEKQQTDIGANKLDMTGDGLRAWHENESYPTLPTDACLSDGCHAQQQCNGEGKNTEKPEEARRMWHASLILYIRLCPSAAR